MTIQIPKETFISERGHLYYSKNKIPLDIYFYKIKYDCTKNSDSNIYLKKIGTETYYALNYNNLDGNQEKRAKLAQKIAEINNFKNTCY